MHQRNHGAFCTKDRGTKGLRLGPFQNHEPGVRKVLETVKESQESLVLLRRLLKLWQIKRERGKERKKEERGRGREKEYFFFLKKQTRCEPRLLVN